MRNKYRGICYRCGQMVEPGDGHFERHQGRWRHQHASCAIKYRGTDHHYLKVDRGAEPRKAEGRGDV